MKIMLDIPRLTSSSPSVSHVIKRHGDVSEVPADSYERLVMRLRHEMRRR